MDRQQDAMKDQIIEQAVMIAELQVNNRVLQKQWDEAQALLEPEKEEEPDDG